MKKYIFLTAVLLALIACNKESSIYEMTEKKVQLIQEPIPNTRVDEVSTKFANSKYLDHYIPTDFTAGISAVKENPLTNVIAYSFNKRYETCSYASSLPQNAKPARILTQGIDLTRPIPSTRSEANTLNLLFGQENTFNITELVTTRNGEEIEGSSTEVSLYIPKTIEITTPLVTSDEDFYPFCYSKDFVLRWNKDPKNQNGVIVVIEWFGVTAGQGDYEAHIRRIDLLDDTGEALLDEELFAGLPNTALINLTLLRGNIENIDLNNCTYKISGEAHAYLSIVLVTRIKEK